MVRMEYFSSGRDTWCRVWYVALCTSC